MTALAFLLKWFEEEERPLRVLWLAPSREILDQAHETLVQLWFSAGRTRAIRIYNYSGDEAEPGAEGVHQLVFATPEKAVRVLGGSEAYPGWDYVIFDEAHQAAAPMRRRLVQAMLKGFPSLRLLGLSATPGRFHDSDTADLVRLFHGRLHTPNSLGENPVLRLQELGVLAKLEFSTLQVAGGRVGQAGTGGVAQGGRLLQSLALDPYRFRAIVECAVEEASRGEKVSHFLWDGHACGCSDSSVCEFGGCRRVCLGQAGLPCASESAFRLQLWEDQCACKMPACWLPDMIFQW